MCLSRLDDRLRFLDVLLKDDDLLLDRRPRPLRPPEHSMSPGFGFEFVETFVKFLQLRVDQLFSLCVHYFPFNEPSPFREFGVDRLIQMRHLLAEAADPFGVLRDFKSQLPNRGSCSRVGRFRLNPFACRVRLSRFESLNVNAQKVKIH
jgi:hypothetical protein